MKYEELLQLTTLGDAAPSIALQRLGMLIDLAHEHRDATGSKHAVTLAGTVTVDGWASTDRALFYYFLANAHTDLLQAQAATRAEMWAWANEDVEQSLLALRRARNEEGLGELPVERQCQILTNLANTLSGVRYTKVKEAAG